MVATAEMLKLATSDTDSGIMEYNLQLSNLKAVQLQLSDAISKLYSCWEIFCLGCNVAFLLGHVRHAELPRADTGAWSALASGAQWSAVWWKDTLWSPLLTHKTNAVSGCFKKDVFIECATENCDNDFPLLSRLWWIISYQYSQQLIAVKNLLSHLNLQRNLFSVFQQNIHLWSVTFGQELLKLKIALFFTYGTMSHWDMSAT